MTIVRSATKADLHLSEQITELVNRIYLDAEKNMYKEDSTRIAKNVVESYLMDDCVALAFTNDSLSGVIKAKEMKENSKVYNFGMFAVDYSYRGEGVGQQLVDFVESRAKKNGAEYMQLEILKPLEFIDNDKERLKKWYTRIGYQFDKSVLFQEVYPQHFHKFKIPVVFDIYKKRL